MSCESYWPKEKKEIERILAELSAQCATHKEDILEDYQLLVWLDAIFARAKLSLKLECTEPRLSDKYLRLRGARHPLLDQKKAVANDLELGSDSIPWLSPAQTPEERRLP